PVLPNRRAGPRAISALTGSPTRGRRRPGASDAAAPLLRISSVGATASFTPVCSPRSTAIFALTNDVPMPPATPVTSSATRRGMLAPTWTRGTSPADTATMGAYTCDRSVPCQRATEIDSDAAPGASTEASSIQARGEAPADPEEAVPGWLGSAVLLGGVLL